MHPVLEEEIERFGPEEAWFVRLWTHYDRGFLLRAGGIADQPNRYLEAMEALTGEINRVRRQEMERDRARHAAGFGDTGKAKLKIHGLPGGGMRR